MPSFSQIEKDVIDKIIAIDDKLGLNVLSNLLEKRFADFTYYVRITPKCEIMISEDHLKALGKLTSDKDGLKYIIHRTSNDLLTVTKMLEWLEKERLIYLINGTQTSALGSAIPDQQYSTCAIDPQIEVLIRKYSSVVIIPTQALRDLRKRGYQSEEEVRHRTAMNFNRITIGLAALSIVASAIVTFLASRGETSIKVTNFPEGLRITNLQDTIRIANPSDNVRIVVKDEDWQKLREIVKANEIATGALLLKQSEETTKRIDAVDLDLQTMRKRLDAIATEPRK